VILFPQRIFCRLACYVDKASLTSSTIPKTLFLTTVRLISPAMPEELTQRRSPTPTDAHLSRKRNNGGAYYWVMAASCLRFTSGRDRSDSQLPPILRRATSGSVSKAPDILTPSPAGGNGYRRLDVCSDLIPLRRYPFELKYSCDFASL